MTDEQRRVLIDLEEKIIQQKLANSDISWIETPEELADLKQALIKELYVNEYTVIGETRVDIYDYQNKIRYIIMGDSTLLEYPIVADKGHNKFLIGTSIMIVVYLLLALLFAWLDIEPMIWTVIVLGIINLVLFRIAWD